MKLPEKNYLYEKNGIRYLCLGYDISIIRKDVKYFGSHISVEDYVSNYRGYNDIKKYIDIFLTEACVLYVEYKEISKVLTAQSLDVQQINCKRKLTAEEINVFLLKKKMLGILDTDVNALLNLSTLKETKAFINSHMGEELLKKRTDNFIQGAKRSFEKIVNSKDWKKDCSFTYYSEFFGRDNEYLSLYIRPVSSCINMIMVKRAKLSNKKECFDLYLSYLLQLETKKRLRDSLDDFSPIMIEEEQEKGYDLYVLNEFSE